MRTLPIKPEHRAELNFLLGEVFHLQRMKADKKKIANAMRKLAKRHLALYPELFEKRIAFGDKMETMDVYDSAEEWVEAIKAQTLKEKEAPYIAFAADDQAKTYDVMGPGEKRT